MRLTRGAWSAVLCGALAAFLFATPAHADPVADLMADHLDCVSQRREHGRELRQCKAEQYLASLEPSWSPWLAWGLGVVGAAAVVAGGVVAVQDQQHRNIGIFTGAAGVILIVAGGYAAAW